MRRAEASERGINSLSDLAAAVNAGNQLLFACNAEFAARADGLKPLQKAYALNFRAPM